MTNPNVVVDTVSNLSPSTQGLAQGAEGARQTITVNFESGRSSYLDMSLPQAEVWADVLDVSLASGEPIYVEIDPETNIIGELLLPLTVNVAGIVEDEAGEAVEVQLEISHARHFLSRSNPDYQQILEALEAAREQGTTVIVTETPDTHEIIDVRPSPKQLAPPMAPESDDEPEAGPPISSHRARELFDRVRVKSCCPASAPAPCIPFLYPDDGCWGRAHEMCRLIIAEGEQPSKVWIYAKTYLRAKTVNHPGCEVIWGWHVAPTVRVNTGSVIETQVIDPSLFNGPVNETTWKGVQGDPQASLVPSSAAVFYRAKSGSVTYDAAYTQTNSVLTTYRNQLKLRSTGSNGPPPYFTCMTKAPGIQWFGTVKPNASRTWYTWGWPAKWHVIWTIMPLTQCRGKPQLSWKVAVERANANQCTYWITVKNHTGDPVKFEGRFDVLSK